MNDPTQHEFDDELLSAYLDDELTPAERALVEARLESDPVARQTLEHLRSVSQSLRDLPTASAGRGLHDAILSRIEAAHASRAESAKSVAPSPPSISIGRTTRGWVWACAAVAAALLIMFLQPSDNENAGLPNVAKNAERRGGGSVDKRLPEQRFDEGSREAGDFARQDLAANEPAPAAPAAGTATVSSELSETATAPTAIPSKSALADNEPTASSFSDGSARAGGREMAALAAPSDGAEPFGATTAAPATVGRSAPASQPATQPIVVHVLANRYAIENKTFDELLRSNGVMLEPATSDEKDKQFSFGVEAEDERLARSERQSSAKPADAPAEPTGGFAPETEAVLVDAPAKTLVSCMNALNSDAENYPGIAVLKDRPKSASESSGVESDSIREEKVAVTELSKFSRGVVPPADVKLGVDMYHFYAVPSSGERGQVAAGAPDFSGGGVGGAYGDNKIESTITNGSATADRGRARRISPRFVEQAPIANRKLNFDVSSSIASDANAQSLSAPIATNENGRLQVLFIIHPNDATATANANTPAPTLKAKLPAE